MTGSKSFRYQGPHDVSARPKQCVASIIGKIQELHKGNQPVNYVNSAADLFRLSNMLSNSDSTGVSNSLEQRLLRLELDVKYLKTSPSLQNPAAIPTPRFKPGVDKRQSLLKSLSSPSVTSSPSTDSPSKRRRTGEPVIQSERSSDSANTESWSTVHHKKNGIKPGSNHVPRGKAPRNQESLEVFLFRYYEEETPDSVLKYFKDMGVNSAHHVRFRCRPDSDTKNFVMKIRDKEDFNKIVLAIPEYTGCRWYVPGPPPVQGDRPPGYFNYGGKIQGPGIDDIISASSVRSGPAMMDISPPTPAADGGEVTVVNVPAISEQPNSTDLTDLSKSDSSAVGNIGQQSTPVTSSAASTSATTVITSSTAKLSGITPINSPHMKATNVNYEVVVSK